MAQASYTRPPNGIFIFAVYESCSRVTSLLGICSSGMVPRRRIPFLFLDSQYRMRSIYADDWTAYMWIFAQASTASISIALYTTVCAMHLNFTGGNQSGVFVEDSWPRQALPTATKTTGDLWRECEKACGPKCFRNIERGVMAEETPWEDWDWREFRTILEIAPDALPCHLAVLCRKPCREVRSYTSRRAVLTKASSCSCTGRQS